MAINFENLEKEIAQKGKIKILDNGLILVYENVPNSGLATGNIAIHAGSGYEKPEDHGIMHFLEHMTFGGSKLYPDKNIRELQAGMIGLQLNALTNQFSVNYPIQGVSKYMLQENFLQAVRIISDLVFFPKLDKESLQREHLIVQRERIENDQKDFLNQFYQISIKIKEKMHSNNKFLLKNSLGTEESIAKINLQTLNDYHSKFFVANNTVVGIIGDLNNDVSLEGEIEKNLAEIPSGEKTQPLKIVPEEPYQGRELLNFESPIPENAEVYLFFQIPHLNSFENPTMNLLNYILGSGIQGLLFQDIREKKGLVYSISTSIEGHDKTGFLKFFYSVAPEHLDDSLQAVDENIQKLKKGEFNKNLVDMFKSANLPGVLYTLKNPGWIYHELIGQHYVERFGFESTPVQRLQKTLTLNEKDVIEAANKYLTEDRLTIVIK